MKKISEFLSENFQFLVVKFSMYLNRRVVMYSKFINSKSHGNNHRPLSWTTLHCKVPLIQSNLIISNSLISNYRLSRSENLVPVLT